MVVMRPIRLDDLNPLLELVKQTGYGLTTLPNDEQVIRRRIEKSLAGFKAERSVQPRTYLFALEDLATGKLAGVCGVVSQVGGVEPFYTFRVDKTVHQSQQLGVSKEIEMLNLSVRNDGPSEIGSLFLSPAYRHGGNGRLLSLCRFLFMADHPDYFEPMVIAEMRGVVDAQGRSAFWDAVGRHFFEVDFPTADHMSMVSKQFIYDLMPRHPIYVPLLPYEAQKVLGQVHPDTQPALRMLQSEGFYDSGCRDLFEGGPTMECRVKDIRAVRESQKLTVGEIATPSSGTPGEGRGGGSSATNVQSSPINPAPHPNPPPEYQGREKSKDRAAEVIITNTRLADFRACKAEVKMRDGKACIESEVANALQVKVGDTIRFVSSVPATIGEGNHA